MQFSTFSTHCQSKVERKLLISSETQLNSKLNAFDVELSKFHAVITNASNLKLGKSTTLAKQIKKDESARKRARNSRQTVKKN